MTLREVLKDIFIRTLNLGPTVDVEKLKYREIEQWDSAAHMELMSALEERFDIVIDTIDVLRINSFEAAIKIFNEKYGIAD